MCKQTKCRVIMFKIKKDQKIRKKGLPSSHITKNWNLWPSLSGLSVAIELCQEVLLVVIYSCAWLLRR